MVLAGGDIADDSLAGADIDEASLDSSVLQRRVSGSCSNGEAIQAIDAAGAAVTCEAVGEPTGPAGGALAGTYPDPGIAADAVGTDEVAADSLAEGDLAANSVGANEIQVAGVTGLEVQDESLFAADLAPGAVSIDEIANASVRSQHISDDQVGSSEIATGAVASAEVLADSLTTTDLATDSVGGSELIPGSVGTAEVGFNSLSGSDVADNSLAGADISESTLGAVPSATALENGSNDLTPGELAEINLTNFPTCDPSAAFISCGTVTSSPTTAARVLLLGSGGFVGTAERHRRRDLQDHGGHDANRFRHQHRPDRIRALQRRDR